MAKFIIEGGNKLAGSLNVNTAKNSTVAILCASLMIKGKTILYDVPRIEEVYRILEILSSIDVKVEWTDEHTLSLDTSAKLQMENMDKKATEITRSSLMLLGALAAREKEFKIYKSGGCRLGERTVKPHLFALEQFGVSVESKNKYYDVRNKPLKSADIVMYESGDTPTENAIMAAVLAPGVTTIKFASSNYMVQDLCYFLQEAGAKIEGIGSTTLKITGVKKLNSVRKYHIIPDPIEAMTFISLAVTTKSEMTIKNCPLDFLELELEKLRVMGQKMQIKNKRKSKNGKFDIVDIKFSPSELIALPDKIYGRPFPGLNIDNLPLFVPILTQAKGRTLVHDWVYENRAIYFLDFQKLGANLTLLDPHRVFVEGPSKLKGNELMCPPAIRPAVALLVAMIAASGKSVMRNSYTIERGYEDLAGRLSMVGANITYEE
ncbi:MAG: UDP-N-acetylglucosamine 1-carboxyvinyltransferase [Candidatus Magasanikbacteria bacterium CG_4_10_14_0_2_um_filter_33_14]|uniref:UDP-N-acetylglucosamine 1-carboxyvinyltransferase n=1 Tax=Candidatus Magasanikbacteria bacterium CG_4_10_14_0_2_um_filter_33_14 TaxID=1974636 RepID=A0A2M7V8W0_9BACT|nr:MAG: UDP-N-acetylglucosamine 1-carboxyvinyltransferase [Candidatus Magasanikbacteria bacterium CG_4_10_14_0_2_um_filter_33_14]